MTARADLEPPPGNDVLGNGDASLAGASRDSAVQENARIDRLARTRLRVLDSTSEGIYQIDSAGLCIFMNRAACRMLGYEFGEAVGKSMHELHHGRPGDTALPVADCPIHGRPQPPFESEPTEAVFRSTDGAVFPVECCSHPIFEKELRHGAVVTFRDITERRRVERRVQAQHAVFRALGCTTSSEEAVSQLLASVGESLDFDWAAFWQSDQCSGELRPSHTWHHPRRGPESSGDSSCEAVLLRRQEVIGKAWASGQPVWVSDLSGNGDGQPSAAAGAGFRSAFVLPIGMAGAGFGVIEFLSHECVPADSDLLEVLRVAASAIGQVVERNRSESVRARLGAILDAATDFVGVVLDPRGVILSISRAVQGIFGFAPSEVIGQSLSVLIPEYRRHLLSDDLSDHLHSCCARMQGRLRSGVTIPLEVSLDEYNEMGSRVIAGVIRDITDRTISEEILERQTEDLRRSEEALRHQTRLVNSIVSSMADGVVVADANGDVMLLNPAAAELIGTSNLPSIPDDAMLARRGCSVFLPDQRTPLPAAQLPIFRAIRGERVDGMDLFIKTPHRPQGFWLNETAGPLIDNDGQVCGGVLVMRDVTERKASRQALRRAKDEAEAANRAKSEFLSRMSHELRTPMNAILGFAQLLSDEPLAPEQGDAIARILKAARHLLGLINEVLDISRIEAGHLNLQLERVRPFEVMQTAIELVGPLALQRRIDIVPPPPGDAQWCIHADRQRLTQVFVNLLGNAIKYNREQGRVSVSLEQVPGALLRIKVADTGPGIAPEKLKRLFVPFERLGAERSGIEGTGIGLAYSNRLVTAMDGTIGVESEVGTGSVFWVEMHSIPPENATHPQGFAPPRGGDDREEARMEVGLAKVLCIQDDPSSFHEIEQMFDRLPGFELVAVSRGDIALRMAREQPLELVVLDLQLPDMDGIEAVRQLRTNMRPRQTPILVVSAGLTDETARRALDAGAHSCLPKPIQMRDLLDIVACLM